MRQKEVRARGQGGRDPAPPSPGALQAPVPAFPPSWGPRAAGPASPAPKPQVITLYPHSPAGAALLKKYNFVITSRGQARGGQQPGAPEGPAPGRWQPRHCPQVTRVARPLVRGPQRPPPTEPFLGRGGRAVLTACLAAEDVGPRSRLKPPPAGQCGPWGRPLACPASVSLLATNCGSLQEGAGSRVEMAKEGLSPAAPSIVTIRRCGGKAGAGGWATGSTPPTVPSEASGEKERAVWRLPIHTPWAQLPRPDETLLNGGVGKPPREQRPAAAAWCLLQGAADNSGG